MSLKMSLSLLYVGVLANHSWAQGLPEMWLIYPRRFHWRKQTFPWPLASAADNLLIKVGAYVHVPFSAQGPHLPWTCVVYFLTWSFLVLCFKVSKRIQNYTMKLGIKQSEFKPGVELQYCSTMRVGLGPEQQNWCKSNQLGWMPSFTTDDAFLLEDYISQLPLQTGKSYLSIPTPMRSTPSSPGGILAICTDGWQKWPLRSHQASSPFSLQLGLFVCLFVKTENKNKTKQTQIMKHNVLSYQGQTLNMIDREREFLKNISHVYMMFLLVSWIWIWVFPLEILHLPIGLYTKSSLGNRFISTLSHHPSDYVFKEQLQYYLTSWNAVLLMDPLLLNFFHEYWVNIKNLRR